jgi:hypothetical protein
LAAYRSRRPLLVAISLVVIFSTAVVLVTIPSRQGVQRIFNSDRFSELFILGEVEPVLNGHLTDKNYFDQTTSDVSLALGAGALESINRTGELMILNGKAYVKPSDSSVNYKMEISTEVLTPFCLGFENVQPSSIYIVKGSKSLNISELYQLVSRDHGRLFAVFRIAQFDEIDLSAIKVAPIYNESITSQENTNKYFHSLKPINDRVGVFFGVVNNPKANPSVGYDSTIESKMFYVNPADKSVSELRNHTHVLVTTNLSLELETNYSQDDTLGLVRTLPVVDISHLLTQSKLRNAVIIVYSVGSAINVANSASLQSNVPNSCVKTMVLLVRLNLFAPLHTRLSLQDLTRFPIAKSY